MSDSKPKGGEATIWAIRRLVFMDTQLLRDIIEAIAEDFSSEQLEDSKLMRRELLCLLNASEHEAEAIRLGALEVRRIKGDREPAWKRLLTQN